MPIVMPENYRKLVTISKSKYVAGAQCLKRLYLLVHEPGLAGGPDAADFALMDQGRQVGKLARQLFPGGVEVKSGDPEVAIRSTRELVANTEVPAIFEGAFEHGGVLVRTDILQRRRDGRWRLIEVKSTADLKDHHLDDVAIQYRVVSRCGLDLASACLAHVNRSYVFPGGTIDPRQFFRIRNLTRRVERLQPKLTFLLRSEFRVLAMPKAPDLPPGSAVYRSHYVRVLRPLQSTALQRTTLLACHESTVECWRNSRRWASSPSATYPRTST